MGGERDPGREAHVRALTRLAQSNGLQRIAENSGRVKVSSKLAEEILALDISQAVRNQVQRALDAYIATLGQAGQNVDASAAGAGADGGGAGAAPARALQSSATKVWKFMAVQLTYKSSHGDFASLEETVLRQLFSRFLAFLAGLARELKARNHGESFATSSASSRGPASGATFSSPWSRRLASVRVRRSSALQASRPLRILAAAFPESPEHICTHTDTQLHNSNQAAEYQSCPLPHRSARGLANRTHVALA